MRRHLWWILGLAVALGGVAVVITAPAQQDFGWFAYAPEDNVAWSAWVADGLLVTRRHVAGVALTVGGLLVLAGLGGYRLGKRRAGRA